MKYEIIFCRVCIEHMTEDFIGPEGIISDGIEKSLVIVGPLDTVVVIDIPPRIRDFLRKLFTRCEIFDIDYTLL
jgi:hypothetical protein